LLKRRDKKCWVTSPSWTLISSNSLQRWSRRLSSSRKSCDRFKWPLMTSKCTCIPMRRISRPNLFPISPKAMKSLIMCIITWDRPSRIWNRCRSRCRAVSPPTAIRKLTRQRRRQRTRRMRMTRLTTSRIMGRTHSSSRQSVPIWKRRISALLSVCFKSIRLPSWSDWFLTWCTGTYLAILITCRWTYTIGSNYSSLFSRY
jgi:hypothetical protein